jgi:hypothetical protein
VRAPILDLPPGARANAALSLIDLADDTLDPLPLGAGAHVIGGEVLSAPVPMHDANAWARHALSERAA